MKRIAVLVSGSGSNLQALIDGIATKKINNATIALVISSKKDVYALQRAANHGIASAVVVRSQYDEDDYQNALLHLLKAYQIDYIVLAGFLDILPKGLTEQYRYGIVNIHPSLIPAFCGKGFYGMRVHQAVYQSAAKISGATVHFVDGGIDSGAIIAQHSIAITDEDTAETIAQKVLKIEHSILPEVVDALVNQRIKWYDGRPFINEGLI